MLWLITKRIIVTDLRDWVILVALFFVAFILLLFYFARSGTDLEQLNGHNMLWAVIGAWDGETYFGNDPNQSIDESIQGIRGSSGLYLIFLVFYLFLAAVVLVNLLIAMMSQTYSETVANADEEWNLLHARVVREFFTIKLMPPPLNLIELFLECVVRCIDKYGKTRKPSPQDNEEEQTDILLDLITDSQKWLCKCLTQRGFVNNSKTELVTWGTKLKDNDLRKVDFEVQAATRRSMALQTMASGADIHHETGRTAQPLSKMQTSALHQVLEDQHETLSRKLVALDIKSTDRINFIQNRVVSIEAKTDVLSQQIEAKTDVLSQQLNRILALLENKK